LERVDSTDDGSSVVTVETGGDNGGLVSDTCGFDDNDDVDGDVDC
jgi:hypothetical protein